MATETPIPGTTAPEPASPVRRMFSWRAFAIIYGAFLVMIAIAAGSVGYWTREHVKSALTGEVTRSLTQRAQMLANRVNVDHVHGLEVIASQEGQAAGARATIIDTNGKAVADSEVPVATLENEGRQPEFQTALRGSTGVATRSRNGAEVLFVAVPVSGGAVRLGYPLSDVETVSEQVRNRILAGSAVSALAGLVLAAAITRITLHRT